MMQQKIHWKNRPFTNSYSIYSNNHLIGKLNEKTFSKTSIGEFENKEFIFKTCGCFKQQTKITDKKEHKIIGDIRFNSWMTKATLSINGKTYYWKYDNLMNTRWRLFSAEGIEIKYEGSCTTGQIDTNTNDSVLLLSGLFVKNYYLQTTIAVLVAIFVPIWISAIN